MNSRESLSVVVLAVALLVAGCGQRGADTSSTKAKAVERGQAAVDEVTDQWLGNWNGPEGTWLRIAAGEGHYDVTIQNLDGPRSFRGSATDAGIEFARDGVKEVIHATNGAGTGMKWLSEKSHCLTVRPGEGYCRD